MTRPAARIPSDVNRPDRILGPFTARQVAILAATAGALYLAWNLLRGLVPLPVFAIIAAPLAALAFVIAVGQRDGMPMDRLLLAAIRHRVGPRRINRPRPDSPPGADVPSWIGGRATTPSRRRRDRRSSGFPARAVTSGAATGSQPGGVGVIDLGPDGVVAIAVVSTVNLTLRTPAEQDGLVDTFARYLNTLSGPVQILVRALPLDLTGHLRHLHDQAGALPHPALAAAAAGHRDHLAHLAAHRDEHELLTRQVLLVLREPTRAAGKRGAEARLLRRLHDAATLLAPLEVALTPLDGAQTTALLTDTCNPDHQDRPAARGPRDVIRRRARHQHDPDPHDASRHSEDTQRADSRRDLGPAQHDEPEPDDTDGDPAEYDSAGHLPPDIDLDDPNLTDDVTDDDGYEDDNVSGEDEWGPDPWDRRPISRMGVGRMDTGRMDTGRRWTR